jgi:hypothetical protein
MMEWVVERGAVPGEATCDNAAKKGDLAMLKWPRQRHCPCDLPVVIEYAAESGNIELLQYMRHQVGDDADNDQAFFVYAGVGAGRAGHVHVCEYLLDNGGAEYIQWAAFAGELAAANGHLSVLQWFAEHDLLLVDCEQAYIEAAVHNHYDVMAFLLAHTPDIPAEHHAERCRGARSPSICAMAEAARRSVAHDAALCWCKR